MNKRKFSFFLLVGLGLVQCTGPTGSDEPDYGVLPRALTAQEIELAASSDRFGLKLFREMVRQQPDSNIFISPLSVSMALGMTANGADSTTLDSMRATLELNDLTEEESNQAYRSLIDLLTKADPKVRFDIANSIWCQQGWTFKNDFYQRCQDYFNAVVQGLDFSDPAAADVINAWVREQTQDKIQDIVDKPLDPMIIMYLINALYFKGTWTYEFDPEDTEDDVFTLPDGSSVPCRMMALETDLHYMATEQFQAVDLPYGDGLFSMTVLLPRAGVHVDSVIGLMTPENWPGWIGALDAAPVLLQMPRFRLEYARQLNKVLSTLGMRIAFGIGPVDFSRMCEPPGLIWIDKVKHKTFVQVDEEGTEAAAVTSVEMTYESAGPSSIPFRVDRPFVFVIRERTSGALLFMGKIVEPVWEEG